MLVLRYAVNLGPGLSGNLTMWTEDESIVPVVVYERRNYITCKMKWSRSILSDVSSFGERGQGLCSCHSILRCLFHHRQWRLLTGESDSWVRAAQMEAPVAHTSHRSVGWSMAERCGGWWWWGGGGGVWRAPFVAMKSSNNVLKWIQAVSKSLRSRLSRGGVQHEECKSKLQGPGLKGATVVLSRDVEGRRSLYRIRLQTWGLMLLNNTQGSVTLVIWDVRASWHMMNEWAVDAPPTP